MGRLDSTTDGMTGREEDGIPTNRANEAWNQRAFGNDINNRATALPQAAAGVAHGGRGENVGGWHRRAAASMRGAATTTALVIAASHMGGGSEHGGGGGSGPRGFLGLMDSTQLSRLVPDTQGVDSLINKDKRVGTVGFHDRRNDRKGRGWNPHQQSQ